MNLVPFPTLGSKQSRFEVAVVKLGLGVGVFAITEDGERYCNEHVQWLWLQFLKAG